MARLDPSVDVRADYERKLTTPEGAAALVESGDLVWIPSGQMPPAILRRSRSASRICAV